MKRLFMCEWCGEIYDDEFKAKKCERGHLIPLNVTPTYYDNQKKIPKLVTVDLVNIQKFTDLLATTKKI